MPTIAEIRQKYPQYQDLPDAALADALHKKFYSDMPAEEFNAKIGLGPASPQPAGASPDQWERATVLPLAKNRQTGEIAPAVPGIITGALESAADAITAPYRAYTGDLQVTDDAGNITPEAIGEGMNAALWVSPASPASRLAGSTKAVSRPKPEGLQVAEAAERLGVDVPRAAVSDSMVVQQAGKNLTSVPIGGVPLRKASETAISQLDDAALRVQQGYGSGSVASAGSAAREGITTHAKEVLPGKVGARYDAVDRLVTPNVVTPLSETSRVAAEILARRENAKIAGNSRAVQLVRRAVEAKDGLNYEGIKNLRTAIGEFVEDPAKIAASGVSEKEIKSIYGALTADLRTSVQRSGGDEALAAFERANTYAAKKFAERADLQKILGRQTSDEGLFSKIEAMAGSTSRADQSGLMKVRGAVGKEAWDEISSAVIGKMGRKPDGSFSPDQFLTTYGKLSPAGKTALFKTTGKNDLAASLDDLATVSKRFKQLNQFANPSGTGQTVIGGAFLPALWFEPTALVSTVASARALSSVLAKPVSAKKLANWAKAYEQAVVKPSVNSSALLKARAEILAAELAAESGSPALANQITQAISLVRNLPAEPEQGNEGRAERQDRRPAQDLSGPEWM
ncbi:hypothetical protein U8C35_07815 [Sinorhizobium medicae]|uniref:hypothetical protein n=1 Tax=Sinorhizobium medicae TaxID=110321 RepID=UPI002AF6C0EC|nr:hypothetical protein [Sinorhizobium medicae]WQO60318.1 hypothetical protein U8C35_07815 [Sinorhizobium medicae]